MLTTQHSCATISARGAVLPSTARLENASMIEAKSVPALPIRYRTPSASSISSRACAVFSTATVLRVLIVIAGASRYSIARCAPQSTPRRDARPSRSADRSELAQQRHDLALEAQRILVVREKHHQQAVHARAVQTVELFGDLLASAEDRQPAPAKGEHLEGKIVERTTLRQQAASPVLGRLTIHLLQDAPALLVGLALGLTPDQERVTTALDAAPVARGARANVISMSVRRPPIRRMSCSSCMPWITDPAPRNISAL